MLSDEHNLIRHQRTPFIKETHDPSLQHLTTPLTASTFEYYLKFPCSVQAKPPLCNNTKCSSDNPTMLFLPRFTAPWRVYFLICFSWVTQNNDTIVPKTGCSHKFKSKLLLELDFSPQTRALPLFLSYL